MHDKSAFMPMTTQSSAAAITFALSCSEGMMNLPDPSLLRTRYRLTQQVHTERMRSRRMDATDGEDGIQFLGVGKA